MLEQEDDWHPGSFTKNFSWGENSGLSELHSIIRSGFGDEMEDVPRRKFKERIEGSGRPAYIPMNFFLFNKVIDGEDFILADELVFQSLYWDHSQAFDRVALFAFIFSYSGRWTGAKPYQRRPAMWANAYVKDVLAKQHRWNEQSITSDDIQNFVSSSKNYKAFTSRKLSTNLNHLLHIGNIEGFSEKRITRWWVDCSFLALDRILADAEISRKTPGPAEYHSLLKGSDFLELTGGETTEKKLALPKIIYLYRALGGRDRFFDDVVKARMEELLPDRDVPRANTPSPRGAVHITNPRILKSIPPSCSELARLAGFDVISSDDLNDFEAADYIKKRMSVALSIIEAEGIETTMSVEELLSMTRSE